MLKAIFQIFELCLRDNIEYIDSYNENSDIIYKDEQTNTNQIEISSLDVGPGNCLINNWIQAHTKEKYDFEGLVIRADFKDYSVISVYFPSGTTGGVRQDFKMGFLADFQEYIGSLKKQIPNLIISGDYNICHKEIDIHDPVRNKTVSGFLPEERYWLDNFINSGFIDSFRSDPSQRIISPNG